MAMSRPFATVVSKVGARTVVRWERLGDLGLVADLALPKRVYVVGCLLPCGRVAFYVGLVDADGGRERLLKHARGGAAYFTDDHPATCLLYYFPAPCAAAEACSHFHL